MNKFLRKPMRSVFRPRFLSLFRQPYRINDLAADSVAGVTVGLIALPWLSLWGSLVYRPVLRRRIQLLRLACFTAIIAGFLISSLGGSRVQIGGPTAAFIPVVLLIIEKHGYGGLIAATIIAGILQIVMGLARMGNLIKFIPWPVTSGFTPGIAVSIMATGAPDLLGIHAAGSVPREFLAKVQWLFENLSRSNLASLLLALLVIAIIYLWPRFGFKRIPGSIVAMLAATILLYLLFLSITNALVSRRWPRSLAPRRYLKGFHLSAGRLSIGHRFAIYCSPLWLSLDSARSSHCCRRSLLTD
jgi:sulfate permease, SulP family